MSWTDEELDGLAREAAGSNHVEYKEAYWHEMEAMLGAEKSSKIGMWWWMSGLVLFIGLASVFVGSANGGFGTKEQMASTVNSNQNEKKTNANVEGATISSNSTNKTEFIENDQSENITPSSSEELRSDIDNHPVDYEQTRKNKASKIHSNLDNDLQKQNVPELQTTEHSRINSSDEPSHYMPASLKNSSPDANHEVSEEATTSSTNEDDLDITKDEINKPIHKEIAQELLATKGWSNELNQDPMNPFNQLPLIATKRIGLYVAVSGGIGQAYAMTKSNNELYQLGVNGGIEFYRKNWAFGIGLGIRQQFTSNLDLINRRQYYSFGSVNVNQNVTYDRLLLGDLQLSASRRFGKSELGLTVSPNYLIGARMSAFQTTEEIVGSKSTMANESRTKKQYVHSGNFNSFGINAGLNYSYTIMQNVSIYTGLNARIGQSILRSNFDGENRKLPLMIELGLKKRF